ncbi:hypothetical protein GCM10010399_64430 [Dactylosporangium fulvum]|uniref:Uncharacterized protein n=1 Tax=Dactylosporangium fulvum TaxID=53359 RepID=A0ABY5W8C5_9ACTN|nr:hypothetical protein [Dactylosporangium fulvum]UWP85734.1 hypothetical protein Dfulv_16430 [Dactylosporangium fulvum]
MVSNASRRHDLLDRFDWASLEHGGGRASDTPSLLAGLTSGRRAEVVSALNHLWDDLFHQGTVYSATVAAAQYVAVLLGEPLIPVWEPGRRPLRARLLDWLTGMAYAVGNAADSRWQIWFGYSRTEGIPLVRQMQRLRPELFDAVQVCLADPDPVISDAALTTTVCLLDAPELAAHRGRVVALVRQKVLVDPEWGDRDMVFESLESWGEDIAELRALAAPVAEKVLWNDIWSADRGPTDVAPF